MQTTMANWQNAKTTDASTKQNAAAARELWPLLDVEQKNEFMSRYKATKASKNMGWVRNFEEELKKQKQSKAESIEKHFTRQCILKK